MGQTNRQRDGLTDRSVACRMRGHNSVVILTCCPEWSVQSAGDRGTRRCSSRSRRHSPTTRANPAVPPLTSRMTSRPAWRRLATDSHVTTLGSLQRHYNLLVSSAHSVRSLYIQLHLIFLVEKKQTNNHTNNIYLCNTTSIICTQSAFIWCKDCENQSSGY